MDPSASQVVRAPGTAYKIYAFWKWRAARRKAAKQLLCESIQRALFPHAPESGEGQYAALAIWDILQEITVPGEHAATGVPARSSARAEKALFGRMPRTSIPGVSFERRLSRWVTEAVSTPQGQRVMKAVGLQVLTEQDAVDIGDLAARYFLQRLEVNRYADPDFERARVWLREEVRKTEAAAVTTSRRAETGVTQAVELSSALLTGGSVGYLVDTLSDIHGGGAALIGYSTSMVVWFGSRVLLSRRPLLPRQVAFRLYVLDVLRLYLSDTLDVEVDRSVASVRAALQRAQNYSVWADVSIPADARGVLEPRGSPDSRILARRTDDAPLGQVDSAAHEDRLCEFRRNVRRLVFLAGDVGENLIQADLIQLEDALLTAKSPSDPFTAMIRVLDSLSR